MRAVVALVMMTGLLAGGCQSPVSVAPASNPAELRAAGLTALQYDDDVEARCDPPAGWVAQPLKQNSKHTHQIWLSPTGRTAYGVIHFNLPFPVGHDLVLWGFLNEMRKSEGEATLIDKHWDANLHALQFVAQGGLYTVRTNLFVRGFDGWAIYAGTARKSEIIPEELAVAKSARDHTEVGKQP